MNTSCSGSYVACNLTPRSMLVSTLEHHMMLTFYVSAAWARSNWPQTPCHDAIMRCTSTSCTAGPAQKNIGYWDRYGYLGHTNGGTEPRIHGLGDWFIADTAFMVCGILLEVLRMSINDNSGSWLRVPDNVRFEIDDVEAKEWTWPDNYFDYIHSRFMVASIGSWSRLIRKAFQ